MTQKPLNWTGHPRWCFLAEEHLDLAPALLLHIPRGNLGIGRFISTVHEGLERSRMHYGHTLSVLLACHTLLHLWDDTTQGSQDSPVPAECFIHFTSGPMIPPFPGQAPGSVVKGFEGDPEAAFDLVSRTCSLRLNLWMWNSCWRDAWIWASHLLMLLL